MLVPFHSMSQNPPGLPTSIPRCLSMGSYIKRWFYLLEASRTVQGATWTISSRREGRESIVGNDWEQESCNRNIGPSSVREAGEAGRRRNLSRKRTFVSDTSKNKISSWCRNVLNVGSTAGLARCSGKPGSRKGLWPFTIESSHAKRTPHAKEGGPQSSSKWFMAPSFLWVVGLESWQPCCGTNNSPAGVYWLLYLYSSSIQAMPDVLFLIHVYCVWCLSSESTLG